MNKLGGILALLVFCGSVIAQECSTLTTETTCNDNSDCAYATTGGSCANKCSPLTSTTCTDTTNEVSCEAVAAGCTISVDCPTLALSQANCDANNACTYAPLTAAQCTLNGTAFQTTCDGLKANQSTCEADPNKCKFTASTFKGCAYKSGQCSNKAEADCNTNYCNKNTFRCGVKANMYCVEHGTENGCTANDETSLGCVWKDSMCYDGCALLNSADCAAKSSQCKTIQPYSCTDKTSGNSCADQNTEALCAAGAASTFCTSNSDSATCTPLTSFCSNKTATECQADTTNCQLTPEVPATCTNKVNANTCSAINSENTCGTTNGCKWNAWKCQNKAGKECSTTDSATACAATTKYCSYTATSACIAKSYSSILAAAVSFVIALVFL